MPTYTYRCDACKDEFDVVQMMSDIPVKSCPKCGDDVRRLIGKNIGIQFTGPGFYVTDNASGNPSNN